MYHNVYYTSLIFVQVLFDKHYILYHVMKASTTVYAPPKYTDYASRTSHLAVHL